MSFLQPILLFGLPLIALPIIIHLINKWRHRSINWGAMMFLLDAKRMTRGMARLRFWLIMLMRMLAIAVLFIAVARPLTTGWLGMTIGAQADTTIILLDRSTSMEQQDPQSRRSKRAAALAKITSIFESLGSGSRVVLIENTLNTPQELDSPEALEQMTEVAPTATSADLPAMLQSALNYVVANQTGRTDVWVCSDRRANDWNSDDGRWATVRDGFSRLKAVRFYLLSYSAPAVDNVAVRVSNVRQREQGSQRELMFDVSFKREPGMTSAIKLPMELVVNGARSVVNFEMVGDEYVLLGHKVPLDATLEGGWGRVEIPADENLLDNVAYFVFSEPPVHHTTIVAEDAEVAKTLRLAATAPLDPALTYTATTLSTNQAEQIDWTASSLILWQAELPTGGLAEQLIGFVRGGRPVLFFPPEESSENKVLALGWGEWKGTAGGETVPIISFRGDADLFANAASGESLAVGKLRTYRYRAVVGDGGNSLARLEGGLPLLTRARNEREPVYFCATLPVLSHSSLAQDGVAFYAMIQRGLSTGAATQGKARLVNAGTELAKEVEEWQPAADASRDVLLSSRWVSGGAYAKGERWLALNRPATEDAAPVLDAGHVDRLFSGLDFRNVEQNIADTGSLASEIWRAFLVLMGVALFTEACLCLPDRKLPQFGSVPRGEFAGVMTGSA
ncbi:MAG: BatA domain-containing protein [Pirellulales bacterium]